MAGLADPERRVLQLLALGEPLVVGELAELAGSEPLMAVEARGLIVAVGDRGREQVRLAHPLYGETLRAALPSLRGRELRLALAERLQARGQLPPADCLRVARWLLEAGSPVPHRLSTRGGG